MGLHNFSLSNDSPNFNSSNPSLGMMCESVDIEINKIGNGLFSNNMTLNDTPENNLMKHISHHKVMCNKIDSISNTISAYANIENIKDWITSVESLVTFCNRDFVDVVNMLKCYGNIASSYSSPSFINDNIISLMKLSLTHKSSIESDRSLNAIDTTLYQTDTGMKLFILDDVLSTLRTISNSDTYDEFRSQLLGASETAGQCTRYLHGYFNNDNIIGGYYYETRKRIMIFNDINDVYKEINNSRNSSCNNSRPSNINTICDNTFRNIRSILGEIYSVMTSIADSQHSSEENMSKYFSKMIAITGVVEMYYSMIAVLQIHYFIDVLNMIIEKLAIQNKHSEIVRTFFS